MPTRGRKAITKRLYWVCTWIDDPRVLALRVVALVSRLSFAHSVPRDEGGRP